ncbi:MAG: pectate lyase, partial [Halapricum sp.]
KEPTREAFAKAVNKSGPRVVVFETSGTIDLGGDWIRVTNDKLWVAGQTAPSPGITLTKGLFQIAANDCVVQHIRSRAGDKGAGDKPSELDAMDSADGTKNNIFDHCSASWSVDETLSIGYNTNNTTVSNCIVSEPLWHSLHPKGHHCYGSLTGNNAKNVAYLGNVRAHARARNPRLKTGTESVVVNSTVFDFKRAVKLGDDSYSSVVGGTYLDPVYSFEPTIRHGHVYRKDNVFRPEGTKEVSDDLEELDEPPIWPDGLEAMPADKAHEEALANAGARPADRTDYDKRIIKEVKNRKPKKGFIDSQSEVGGYPELEENTRSLEVPDSDLRNWLQWHALAVEESDISF